MVKKKKRQLILLIVFSGNKFGGRRREPKPQSKYCIQKGSPEFAGLGKTRGEGKKTDRGRHGKGFGIAGVQFV